MNKGFEQISKSSVVPSPAKTFSTDYPQKGFVHKVEKGETVSSIAKKYESKVKWIIDANQIVDPQRFLSGRTFCSPKIIVAKPASRLGRDWEFDFWRYTNCCGNSSSDSY